MRVGIRGTKKTLPLTTHVFNWSKQHGGQGNKSPGSKICLHCRVSQPGRVCPSQLSLALHSMVLSKFGTRVKQRLRCRKTKMLKFRSGFRVTCLATHRLGKRWPIRLGLITTTSSTSRWPKGLLVAIAKSRHRSKFAFTEKEQYTEYINRCQRIIILSLCQLGSLASSACDKFKRISTQKWG